jgi:hypothetical protein
VHQTALEDVRAATRALVDSAPPVAVLVSPHASKSGVYVETRGDLSAFGVPRADARLHLKMDLVDAVAERWGRPLIDEPLDHGIVVPLLLGFHETTVIAVGLEEGATAEEDEVSLAGALRSLGPEISVVASVNTGAGITPRAPLSEIPGSIGLESGLRDAMERDGAELAAFASRLGREAGSCGGGPLGVLARLFAGRRFATLAHEWPFGVGYLVARTAEGA